MIKAEKKRYITKLRKVQRKYNTGERLEGQGAIDICEIGDLQSLLSGKELI